MVIRRLEWQNVVVTLDDSSSIKVEDIDSEVTEELTFRDRVIKFSVGYDHLVVATSTQVRSLSLSLFLSLNISYYLIMFLCTWFVLYN